MPALGSDDYAASFSEIIVHSRPRFAIGIFGDWGSGKTTLMRAIEEDLRPHDGVVTVWFNAWRYEREEHLIVPLLDTLREGLVAWGELHSGRERRRARQTAAVVARAARALAYGLKLSANLPVSVEIDPGKVMESWRGDRAASRPLSFYHASFNAMREAMGDFVDRGVRRVVFFVDDLDRCLPMSALEVLESMKLFFDLEGFVFVVGLDQTVIERSIELKYATPRAARDSDRAQSPDGEATPRSPSGLPVSGADYIKKIFQVPFGIPRISRNDLRAFFESVVSRADLAEEQRQDLENVVWPHLDAGAAASVNPREVKRLINAYTLQMKLLSAKLEDEEPDPHVVLALQTMSFRPDWRGLYETVTADPDLFVAALRKIADHGGADAWIGREPVPQSFVRYLDAVGRPLFDKPSLDVYLTSAEATRSSDPLLAEAHRAVLELHGGLKQLLAGGDASAAFAAIPGSLEALTRIREFLHDRESQSRLAAEAVSRAKSLESRLKEAHEAGPTADTPPGWLRDADRDLAGLDEILRELRRESHVGGRAVA